MWDVEEKDATASSLLELAAHLETTEYASAPVGLKARALQALCEKVVDALNKQLEQADSDLKSSKRQSSKEEAQVKKAAKDAAKASKEAAALRKAKQVESFRAVEAAQKVHDEAKEAVQKSMLLADGTLPQRQKEVALAKKALEEARVAHRASKAAALPPSAVAAAAANAEVAGASSTSRQLDLKKKVAEEAVAAEKEAARKAGDLAKLAAAREAVRRRLLSEKMRIAPRAYAGSRPLSPLTPLTPVGLPGLSDLSTPPIEHPSALPAASATALLPPHLSC